MDDHQLTRRLAADLDGSFEALVHGHVDRCYAIALRILGDPRDAEEVAQDALVRAYHALASYEPQRIRELRLRGWLATIVANLARNRLRRHRPATTPLAHLIEIGLEPVADDTTDPETLAGRRVDRDELADAILRFPSAIACPSCCATSTTCPMTTSQPRSTGPWAPSRPRSIEASPSSATP